MKIYLQLLFFNSLCVHAKYLLCMKPPQVTFQSVPCYKCIETVQRVSAHVCCNVGNLQRSANNSEQQQKQQAAAAATEAVAAAQATHKTRERYCDAFTLSPMIFKYFPFSNN